MANHVNLGILTFQLFADQSSRVAASIVYNNDLPSRRDLGEHLNHRFYGASDISLLVECRKNYRYVAH